MELTNAKVNQGAGAARVHSIIDRFGCLPSIQPMKEIPRFDPLALAQGIEANLNQAGDYGHTKITIHLDLPDAKALAQFLRGR